MSTPHLRAARHSTGICHSGASHNDRRHKRMALWCSDQSDQRASLLVGCGDVWRTGPTLGMIWNLYVFGVYFGVNWAWQIALGTLAIRRVQKIPAWAAVATMLVIFALSMFFESVFVR